MKNTTEMSLQYYDRHAESFIDQTIEVRLTSLHEDFINRLLPGSRILDLGCGSGRDSKVFINHGFQVVAVDGSREMCKRASGYLQQQAVCTTFEEYQPDGMFDGIWACASLLHLKINDIQAVMQKLAEHLNPGGCFYASFKYGEFSGERNGRFFTDMTESTLHTLVSQISALRIAQTYITSDARPERADEKWLNVFLIK